VRYHVCSRLHPGRTLVANASAELMETSRVVTRLDAALQGTAKISDIRWWTLVASATVERYRRHLSDIYGFEAAFEAAIAYTPGLVQVMGHKPVTRAGLVATDLLNLGMTPHEIANLPQSAIAPFHDPAIALGWWYVVDKSTRTFSDWYERLAIQMPGCDAFAYLSSMRDADDHWVQLGQLLDRIATTAEVEAAVTQGVHQAVQAERTWYRRTHPIRALVG